MADAVRTAVRAVRAGVTSPGGPAARAVGRVIDVLVLGTLGIRTRTLRSALAALGIVLSIATIVLVTAIPASSQAALDERLTALGTDTLRVDTAGGDDPVTLPPAAAAMLERIGPVTHAATVENLHVGVRRVSEQQYPDPVITALAVDGALLAAVHGRVAHGRGLPPGALPEVVLGSHAAARLGLATLPARTVTIDVGGVRCGVVGVLAPTPLAVDLESSVLMTSASAERFLHASAHPTGAFLTADEDSLGALRSVVASTLSPEVPGSVVVSRPSAALAAKRETNQAFEGLFLGLASVALLVGGIGIADTMFVSVLERRREIGLRRALGARRADILAQFLLEAVVLGVVGGVAGLAVGAASGAAWSASRGWPLVVPLQDALLALAASVVVAAIAGLAPSVRAARQSPVSALSAD